jgi:hypothetical protein
METMIKASVRPPWGQGTSFPARTMLVTAGGAVIVATAVGRAVGGVGRPSAMVGGVLDGRIATDVIVDGVGSSVAITGAAVGVP